MRLIVFSLLPNRLTSQKTCRWTPVFCAYFITNILIWNMPAQATTVCAAYASARSEESQIGAGWNEPTRNLVAFYSALLAEGKLDEADLLKMRDDLVRGELANPFPRIGSTAIQNQQFKRQIASLFVPKVNTAHVLLWVDNELRTRGKERARRVEQKENTQLPFREIEFARVEPDSFLMGQAGMQVATILTQPYFAMTTQVTQWMWVREFEEYSSRLNAGDLTVEIEISGKRIRMQPDHPVENVTWWSWLEFANRLSKRYGLQPAYDLSKIKFDPNTSAAKGTWMPLPGEDATNEMLVNHPSHNIYKTEGIRLPTEAEWEFLVRNRGSSNDFWHSGNDETDLKKVAWYKKNAHSKTHPVAQLDPLKVDGNSFYDLHGNVTEWVWDRGIGALNGGVDPVGDSAGSFRIHRGGGWYSDPLVCESGYRNYSRPEGRYGDMGARLVTSGAVILK